MPGRARAAAPTRADLEAARGRRVPDLLAPSLRVLLCGINPSLWSAAVGHHFARPGNRFWQALHDAGFTARLLQPADGQELLRVGVGITNLVPFATARADEVGREEFRDGRRELEHTVAEFKPRCVAFLGVTAYRLAYDEPRAGMGLQERTIAGARVWVLPNPSGLNAHYQRDDLARVFGELRAFVDAAEE